MSWIQVKLSISPDVAETYEDILLAVGALSVTFQDAEDQPIFEPDLGTTPLWQNTVLSGLFSAEQQPAEILAAIDQLCEGKAEDLNLKAEILEDKDWEREWMSSYQPMQFGERLWVCPSWCEAPDPQAVNLLLDPGLAFGTGTHPTTALCLNWLDKQALEGASVTDYGCGSGILGVAALLLGAEHVTAVDIDPQALQATEDNLQRNQLEKQRLDCYLPEHAPELATDVVVANILAGPLVELSPELAKRCKPGGKLVLSGLLSQQRDEIFNAYQQWFELDEVAEREGWIRISGIRKHSDQ